VASEAECTLCRAPRPDRPQIDANRRENRDMQNCQDTFGELFLLVEFESYATETQVEHPGATITLVTNNGVGVRARHGDAFCFALNGVNGHRLGRGRLLRQGSCGSGRGGCKIRGNTFRDATR